MANKRINKRIWCAWCGEEIHDHAVHSGGFFSRRYYCSGKCCAQAEKAHGGRGRGKGAFDRFLKAIFGVGLIVFFLAVIIGHEVMKDKEVKKENAPKHDTTQPKTAAVGQANSDVGVTIGNLTWTKQNINIETPDSWCYENDKSNCAKYGRLYDWDAAKKACQGMGDNWRLPTDEDWDNLMTAVGGVRDGESYKHAGKKLKSKSGWNDNGNGSDDYGFSALPGGFRDGGSGGIYDEDVGNTGSWWSATQPNDDPYRAYRWTIYDFGNDVTVSDYIGSLGASVRCVKN